MLKIILIALSRLKDLALENQTNLTLGHLGDIIERKYAEVDINKIKDIPDVIINNVLDRIEDRILSIENKKHVKETIQKLKQPGKPSVHSKMIVHYFIKLMEFQKDLQDKEMQIKDFCDICNTYMVDKRLIYDNINFRFSIKYEGKDNEERVIELRHLSSGEKQIVSLFSHVYLSGTRKYFVLIDEPELSLSVPWQRKFLIDIKKGEYCAGLIAATHSPFIYDNDLKKNTHGIGEFAD